MNWFLYFSGGALWSVALLTLFLSKTVFGEMSALILGTAGCILFGAGAIVDALAPLKPTDKAKSK